MSFRCQICNEAQGSGERPFKVVTEIRHAVYPVVKTPDGKIKIPEGHEIVREVNTCAKCKEAIQFN